VPATSTGFENVLHVESEGRDVFKVQATPPPSIWGGGSLHPPFTIKIPWTVVKLVVTFTCAPYIGPRYANKATVPTSRHTSLRLGNTNTPTLVQPPLIPSTHTHSGFC